ncbi:MAG TPA: hypothetical protein VNG13_15995 [Mycobacteriales bacterium]|nr:hypothetical protein [Mycobacteriales bacterium]
MTALATTEPAFAAHARVDGGHATVLVYGTVDRASVATIVDLMSGLMTLGVRSFAVNFGYETALVPKGAPGCPVRAVFPDERRYRQRAG